MNPVRILSRRAVLRTGIMFAAGAVLSPPLLVAAATSHHHGSRKSAPAATGYAHQANPLTGPYATACAMEPTSGTVDLRPRHESAVADRVFGQDDAHAAGREEDCRRQPQADR